MPFTTNETAVGSRLILLVFDLEGIGVGGGRGATLAASRFLDQLTPADRVGVLAFPNGANLEFTANRDAVKKTLNGIVGRGSFFMDGIYNLGISEAYDIDRGEPAAFDRVVARECSNAGTSSNPEVAAQDIETCKMGVQSQARATAMVNRQRGMYSLQTLRSILTSFAKIDAPKTVVWISEGLPLAEDRIEVGAMAAMAATARTTIYSLHLDQTLMADASRGRTTPSPLQDRQLEMDGLAMIAGITRGTMFTSIGTGSNVFERIAREMTAYYLLSAEPAESDRDGKTHRIKVAVNRKDVSIRARRDFTHAPGGGPATHARAAPRDRAEAAAAGDGAADQGRHLQPADAGRADRQGRGDGRVRPHGDGTGRGVAGLRRVDWRRQARRRVVHQQQSHASSYRRRRTASGDDHGRSAAWQVSAAAGGARCRRTDGQRRASARSEHRRRRRRRAGRPAPRAGRGERDGRRAPHRRPDHRRRALRRVSRDLSRAPTAPCNARR